MRGGVLSEGDFLGIINRLTENDPTLTTLDIGRNNIGDNGAIALAGALKDNKTLTTLDISHNMIGVAGAKAIALALKVNETLTTLNMYNNRFTSIGAEEIGKALEVNKTLTTLNINSNNIRVAGAQAIAKALETNATLITLDIEHNHIDNEGAEAIANALKINSALTTLYISRNNIGPSGAEAIAEALETNATLTKLDISSNNIGISRDFLELYNFMEKLRTALIKNKTLTTLNISMNDITKYNSVGADLIAYVLKEVLTHNKTLTSLDISANKISVDEVKIILIGLKKNNTLTELIMNTNTVDPPFGYYGENFTRELEKAVKDIKSLIEKNRLISVNVKPIFEMLADKGMKYMSTYKSSIPSITNTPKNNNNLRKVKTFINSLKLNNQTQTNIMNLNTTEEGQNKAQALIFHIPLYIHLQDNPNIDKIKFINEYEQYLENTKMPILPPDIWKFIFEYLYLENGKFLLHSKI